MRAKTIYKEKKEALRKANISIESSLKSTMIKKPTTIRNYLLKSLSEINSVRYDKESADFDFIDYKVEKNVDNELIYSYSNNEVSSFEHRELMKMLKLHYLFKDFCENDLKIVVEDLYGCAFEKDQFIFQENDQALCFYIIKSGSVNIQNNYNYNYVFKENNSFGEIALYNDSCKRLYSAKCLTDCEIYILEGLVFRNVFYNKLSYFDNESFIDSVPFFKNLDNSIKYNISSLICVNNFSKNEKLEKSFIKDKIFVIKKGAINKISKNKEENKKLTEMEYFGENNFILSIEKDLDFYCLQDCYLMTITLNCIIESMGLGFKEMLIFSFFQDAFYKSTYLHSFLDDNHINEIYQIFEMKFYKKGDIVYPQDHNNNKKLTFMIEGNLIESKANLILSRKGEFYGEEIINANEK